MPAPRNPHMPARLGLRTDRQRTGRGEEGGDEPPAKPVRQEPGSAVDYAQQDQEGGDREPTP